MSLTEKEVIVNLQDFGFKARYSNICFFYNSKSQVVGGCIFHNYYTKVYFKVVDEDVFIVEGYDDIYSLIFGFEKGD